MTHPSFPTGARRVVFAGIFAVATFTHGAEYFVAPEGDDRNVGAKDAPWRTVQHAFARLAAGDTLNLRSGSYFESGLRLRARGTAERPVVIQSDPADLKARRGRAIIDAAAPDFEKVPNDLWEPAANFSPAAPVYRTRERFPAATWVNAWLLTQNIHGATIPRDIQLVSYSYKENLESTYYVPTRHENTELPLYIGPGVHLGEDGHIYIRLTINPLDARDAGRKPIMEPPYTNTQFNPAHYRIALTAVKEDRPRTKGETYSFTPALITLEGAAHIHFKRLILAHANAVMRWNASSDGRVLTHHIEVDHCTFKHGESGLLAYGARDSRIVHSEFYQGAPDWLHWRDVKGSAPLWKDAFPEFQSFAINGVLTGFTVANNLIHHTMDGLLLRNRTVGAKVLRNIIRNTHDDAINLDPNVKDVEIAWNVMRHCHAGMSLILPFGISSTTNEVIPETKGPVYIHHNVIDLSEYKPWGREAEGTLWSTGSHFASHGRERVDVPWKIYNNTIIGLSPTHKKAGLGLGGRQIQTPDVQVYNNIFYSIGDRPLLTGVNTSTGAHYDGNVFRRSASDQAPLLRDFGDGGTYSNLAEFLGAQRKSGGAANWEVHALEIVDDAPEGPKPLFDVAAIRAPIHEPARLWELYRPKNHPEVLTAGARIPASWPGASAANYRGAVGPGAMPAVGPQ